MRCLLSCFVNSLEIIIATTTKAAHYASLLHELFFFSYPNLHNCVMQNVNKQSVMVFQNKKKKSSKQVLFPIIEMFRHSVKHNKKKRFKQKRRHKYRTKKKKYRTIKRGNKIFKFHHNLTKKLNIHIHVYYPYICSKKKYIILIYEFK